MNSRVISTCLKDKSSRLMDNEPDESAFPRVPVFSYYFLYILDVGSSRSILYRGISYTKGVFSCPSFFFLSPSCSVTALRNNAGGRRFM